MKVVAPKAFDSDKIAETVRRKRLSVNGQSVIIPWWKNLEVLAILEVLAGKLEQFFAESVGFVPQQNFHSTIVSWVLDPFEREAAHTSLPGIPKGCPHGRTPERCCQGPIDLRATVLVAAATGTVSLVLRNETKLPWLRHCILGFNPMVKPNTLDGDFINTCTIVLGHVLAPPDVSSLAADLERVYNDWKGEVGFSETLVAEELLLVRYFDLSLTTNEELYRL